METLVLVLTDVQGSTRLWAEEAAAMDLAMARHHAIVHGAVEVHGGFRPPDQGEGDAVFAAFPSPTAALACVVKVQRELDAEPWPTSRPLRVRIGVHVGEVTRRGGNLFGDPVNRCARIRGLGHGGQTLLSAAVHELVRDRLPAGVSVIDLGEHRMKDLTRPEHVHQVEVAGLPNDFPPLASLDLISHNLPVQPTPFIGREVELAELVAAVREHRLVTLTAFGGMGKTRIALQAAAELAGDLGDAWFVDLAGVSDPSLVPARVAEAAGVSYEDDPVASLVTALADRPTLLVLDNLEQVLGCAGFVSDLVARAPAARVLATSREPLRVRAERQVPLAPMALPTAQDSSDLELLGTFEAVRFFVDRARAVKPGFAVTNETAPAVAAICARLDGHPLALELAAARVKMMGVDSLLSRLDTALAVLTGGSRDMPARHQTLRATIAWSVDALEPDQQELLARMAVLTAPADFEMLEAVCGDGLDVFSLLEELVDRSLVRTVETMAGETRYDLLVSIRDYAAELLTAEQDLELRERHAVHVHGLFAAMDPNSFEPIAVVRRELPHVRAALAHRGRQPGQAYVDLVVALADGLTHFGLVAEGLGHVHRALGLVCDPLEEAGLAASATLYAPQQDYAAASQRGLAAARVAGDPVFLAQALLARCAAADVDVPAVDLLVAEYQSMCEQLAPAARETTDLEAANILGGRLRFLAPVRCEALLREALLRWPDEDVLQARLAWLLLDHGRVAEAQVLADEVDVEKGFHGIRVWQTAGRLLHAQVLLAHGLAERARVLVTQVLDELPETSRGNGLAAQVAADLERWSDDPAAALAVGNRVLGHLRDDGPGAVASVLWRQARALLELGRREEAGALLATAVPALAVQAAPLELLGALATTALLVYEEDSERAARLLGCIAAHRGAWVLPHLADRDVEHLEALLLPAHQAAWEAGRSLAPVDA